MLPVLKKELKTMFLSPVGYIVIAIFLFIFSGMFYLFSINSRSIDLGTIYFAIAMYALPILVSVLTMKSFSGERSKKTEQLLYISPRNTISIVLGKFFALVLVICIAVAISSIYYLILSIFGNPSFNRLLVIWLGFILLSMAYISFGILISSLTESQIVSAIITLIFLMLPIFITSSNALSYLILIDFFQKFATGVITVREIVCLVSFTIMCVTITTIGIEKRRN